MATANQPATAPQLELNVGTLGTSASDGEKVIPLNLSINDMKASNEAAVTQIEDAGKKAGAEEERKRVSALTAAFPNEPAFVAECIAKEGFSVTDAKAAKYDVVILENAELKKTNAELTEKTKQPNVEFAASDSEGKGASVDEGSVDEKDAKSVAIWNKDEKLRAAYNGSKSLFQATYRNDPATALSFGK